MIVCSFVNNRTLGTVISIKILVIHYGTFVHPQNNLGSGTLIRTIVAHYGSVLSHGIVSSIKTIDVCYGLCVV